MRIRLTLKKKAAIQGVAADGRRIVLFKATYTSKAVKLTIYCLNPPPYVILEFPASKEVTEYGEDDG